MFVERAAVTIAKGTLFGPRLNAFDRYLATAAGVLRRRADRLRLRLGIGFTLTSDQPGGKYRLKAEDASSMDLKLQNP